MGAYDEIVDSIDPTKHEMKWSLTLGLPPEDITGHNTWWDIHLQFMTWRRMEYGEMVGVIRGITFTKKYLETSDPEEVPEVDVPRAVIDRCIDFFENE